MATIAVFRFPPETIVIGRVFEAYPGATIEIERVIPIGDGIRPYLWVEGITADAIHSLLSGTSGIEGVDFVDTFDGRSLLRCDCARGHGTLFDVIADCDVSLLAAKGGAEGWTLTLRGVESAAVTEFDRASREAGLDPDLRDLHEATHPSPTGTVHLTDRQRAALRLAYRRGYYEEPRETTLGDVAAELDISRQALANRLRRGYRTLIRRHVLDAD